MLTGVTSSDPPLFELREVVVEAGDARPLDGVSLCFEADGIHVVVGESGSGKSTLLRLLNRLEVPTSGTVAFRGDDISALDPLRLRRQVGMVFQRPTLFPGTVLDNLRVAAPDLDEDAAGELCTRVGLPADLLSRIGDDLSGGEAQRACLARSLAAEPDVLLMDEVTSSLDRRATRVLEDRTQELAAAGTPIVWVTHDLDQALRLDPEPTVLSAGRLATDAERAAFLSGSDDHDEGADRG
jgi:putative ABC transport system ATP-binding protein